MNGIQNWLLGAVFFLSTAAGAIAGDVGAGSSGGGDNVADDTGAAWFARPDRVIQACFELSPDFGVTPELAKFEIENAFASWQEYIDRKFKFATTKLGFPSRISVNTKCTGIEDLVFYLGAMTEEVRLARAQYTNPTAFAFKRFYSTEALWGQGFIWLAPRGSVFPQEGFPDWAAIPPGNTNESFTLRAMLVHEIGHVLGNPHVSGTVMTERISEVLRAGGAIAWFASEIDQSRELSVCWQCDYEWNGHLSIDGKDPYATSNPGLGRMEKENFQILTGHLPKTNSISAKITYSATLGTVLTVHDQLEEYLFPIQFQHDPIGAINYTLIEDSALIFKRLMQSQPTPGFFYEKVQGLVNYGSLTTSAGEQVTIILERNLPVPERPIGSHSQPDFLADFRLKMITKGQLRPLFEANRFDFITSSSGTTRPFPIPLPSPQK